MSHILKELLNISVAYAACNNLHNTCIQSYNIPVTSELTVSGRSVIYNIYFIDLLMEKFFGSKAKIFTTTSKISVTYLSEM